MRRQRYQRLLTKLYEVIQRSSHGMVRKRPSSCHLRNTRNLQTSQALGNCWRRFLANDRIFLRVLESQLAGLISDVPCRYQRDLVTCADQTREKEAIGGVVR